MEKKAMEYSTPNCKVIGINTGKMLCLSTGYNVDLIDGGDLWSEEE